MPENIEKSMGPQMNSGAPQGQSKGGKNTATRSRKITIKSAGESASQKHEAPQGNQSKSIRSLSK